MKISIDIDCTPDEMRQFFGLPDVTPMQQRLMAEMEKKMMENLAAMDPESMMKTWLPFGMEGLEKMQRAFWSQMAASPKREPKG